MVFAKFSTSLGSNVSKIFNCICIAAFLFSISGCASIAHVKKTRCIAEEGGRSVSALDAKILPATKKLRVGEKLTYKIAWLGVPVGMITSHIKEITKINESDVYHIELTVKTNGFCSAIYKIDDRFVTYMDTTTLLPVKHELKRREGRHRKNYIVEYDHNENTATYHDLREGWTRTTKIPKGAHDPLSAMYFHRTEDVEVGTDMSFYVNMNEKNYHIIAEIEEKAIVDVPGMGLFDAIKMNPRATLNGKPEEKGTASGYVSCDEARVPLFGVVNVWVRLIGRVTLTLSEIR